MVQSKATCGSDGPRVFFPPGDGQFYSRVEGGQERARWKEPFLFSDEVLFSMTGGCVALSVV